jgi:hypothetical protein
VDITKQRAIQKAAELRTESEKAYLDSQIKRLTLVAPQSGNIHFAILDGMFAKKGDVIAAISV